MKGTRSRRSTVGLDGLKTLKRWTEMYVLVTSFYHQNKDSLGPLSKQQELRTKLCNWASLCLRPYHVENTGSRPITEVKQRRAWLVLRWVTAWEHHVL